MTKQVRRRDKMIINAGEFTKHLMKWNRNKNNRSMPWKGEKDPYKIWLSEIILQQTRVEQGLAYYNRFIQNFPTIHNLANAEEKRIYKLWEGLGYYSRCSNLILTAKLVSGEMKGKFPGNFDDLLKLKGIGSYTASAIASFAFNLPHAVVDGNVFRVLSRYSGNETPVDTPMGKNYFLNLADHFLDKKNPGIFNQAIMDFGAVICKPRNPACSECPLKKTCNAHITNRVDLLPVKKTALIRKERWMHYLLISHGGKLYVRKRTDKDIWKNLYEFVLMEETGPVEWSSLQGIKKLKPIFPSGNYSITQVSRVYKQQLTHQLINGQFVHIKSLLPPALTGYELMDQTEMDSLPFPKFITAFLKD